MQLLAIFTNPAVILISQERTRDEAKADVQLIFIKCWAG